MQKMYKLSIHYITITVKINTCVSSKIMTLISARSATVCRLLLLKSCNIHEQTHLIIFNSRGWALLLPKQDIYWRRQLKYDTILSQS